MRKSLFIILSLCLYKPVMAQADTTPIYLRFPTVPVFAVTKIPDSIKFTRDDLSKNKATLFIIFNPFCDHCKILIKELTAHIGLFEKTQVILTSPIEYSYLKKFYDELKIADYPGIMMGRDPSNYFGSFFNVRSVPAVFVYDRKGNFVKFFNETSTVDQIAEVL